MAISKNDILQYSWLGREEGFTALEHEIIFRDLCSGCGACAAVCPEKVIDVDEFPVLTGKCTNCGYCIIQCPRSFFQGKKVEEALFKSHSENPLGTFEFIFSARSTDKGITDRAQDGGFVTALLKYLFEKNEIDGAIVSALGDKPLKPVARLITSVDELYNTGGTRYSNSPTLSALKEAKEKEIRKLALVGPACQVEGARKLQLYPIEDVEFKMIKFTIALFCKSNFLYDGLKELIEKKYKLSLEKVRKLDIKGKNLIVTSDAEVKIPQGRHESHGLAIAIPLDEAYQHRREGCKVCHDFTSRISDFSVGSVGSPSGYSTVIARNKAAVNVFNEMKKAKLIDTQEVKMEKQGIEAIELLQHVKEKDAKKFTRRRIREVLPLPFKGLKF